MACHRKRWALSWSNFPVLTTSKGLDTRVNYNSCTPNTHSYNNHAFPELVNCRLQLPQGVLLVPQFTKVLVLCSMGGHNFLPIHIPAKAIRAVAREEYNPQYNQEYIFQVVS